METIERIERLERFYEKLFHDYELLAIQIPRLCDILENYLSVSKNYRYELSQEIGGIRDFTRLTDSDMQEHFKSHADKKIKSKHASIWGGEG
jgi:hypothetical protein